jgi:hypothetical protein
LGKYDSNVIKVDAGTVVSCPSYEVQVKSLRVAHFAFIDRSEVRRNGTGRDRRLVFGLKAAKRSLTPFA